jgi:hypothetical protein
MFVFAVFRDRTAPGLLLGIVMLAVCLAIVIGIEFVKNGLRKRKFWAWVAGLCIFGIYLPSLFFPLGALGLWGLLDEGSRSEFGVSGKTRVTADGDNRTL